MKDVDIPFDRDSIIEYIEAFLANLDKKKNPSGVGETSTMTRNSLKRNKNFKDKSSYAVVLSTISKHEVVFFYDNKDSFGNDSYICDRTMKKGRPKEVIFYLVPESETVDWVHKGSYVSNLLLILVLLVSCLSNLVILML